jgi:hypothetical protein
VGQTHASGCRQAQPKGADRGSSAVKSQIPTDISFTSCPPELIELSSPLMEFLLRLMLSRVTGLAPWHGSTKHQIFARFRLVPTNHKRHNVTQKMSSIWRPPGTVPMSDASFGYHCISACWDGEVLSISTCARLSGCAAFQYDEYLLCTVEDLEHSCPRSFIEYVDTTSHMPLQLETPLISTPRCIFLYPPCFHKECTLRAPVNRHDASTPFLIHSYHASRTPFLIHPTPPKYGMRCYEMLQLLSVSSNAALNAHETMCNKINRDYSPLDLF